MSLNNKHITLNSKIKRNADIFYNQVENETVFLLSIENSEYYAADEIGSIIWQKLENITLVSELINELTNEYDVNAETCQKDVLEFLNKMHEKKLVIITPTP